MSDSNSQATVLLVSRLCAEGMEPLKTSEFWALQDLIAQHSHNSRNSQHSQNLIMKSWCVSDGDNTQGEAASIGLGALLGGLSEEQLVGDWGLAAGLAARVARLMDRATAVAFELERLELSGIRTFTVFDEHYPRHWLTRLAAKAPPVLHAAGAVESLNTPGVGVVGSRNVSAAGAVVAERVAQCAANMNLPLVSGGARGVDQFAMNAALKAGGAVVGILADSLARKVKYPDVRRAIYDGNTLMCTPYGLNAPFNVGNAMGRNKLIYAQAVLTVVVASDHGNGGTWAGASEALKKNYGKVVVWRGDGEGPGNKTLQKLGATPLFNPDNIQTLLHTYLANPASRNPNPDPEFNPHMEPSLYPESSLYIEHNPQPTQLNLI